MPLAGTKHGPGAPRVDDPSISLREQVCSRLFLRSMIHPTALALTPDNRLQIDWSDGSRREYRYRELRDACPCATCREKRAAPPQPANLLTVLKPEETRPLGLLGMKPVGNYAYSIEFSDGHDTGIFTFDLLGQLGQP